MDMENGNISAWTISSRLTSLGFETEVEASHLGQRLDLLAYTPNGRPLALEIKNWPKPDDAMIAKAKKQSELLARSAEIEDAWIIIPSLPDAQQETGVLNLEGLMKAAQDMISSEPDFGLRGTRGTQHRKSASSRTKSSKRVFVAMPFAEKFEDTYYLGIVPAVREASAVCVRVDQQYLSKQVVDSIHTEIRLADAVIADLTDGNPNVTYELGFAHALNKPSIHISASEPEKLPFDLRQWSTQAYKLGGVHELKKKLPEMIRQALMETSKPK